MMMGEESHLLIMLISKVIDLGTALLQRCGRISHHLYRYIMMITVGLPACVGSAIMAHEIAVGLSACVVALADE
jgi:hypothetical protein